MGRPEGVGSLAFTPGLPGTGTMLRAVFTLFFVQPVQEEEAPVAAREGQRGGSLLGMPQGISAATL